MLGGQRGKCGQEMRFQTVPISSNWGKGIPDLYVNPREVTPVGAPLNEGTGPWRKSSPQLYLLGRITEVNCPSICCFSATSLTL